MAYVLYGASLVYIDVSRCGTEHTLVWAQGGRDDGGIRLRASHEEVHVGIGSLTSLADEGAGMFAELVLAIAGRLHKVCFGETFKDTWMRSFVIVALELILHWWFSMASAKYNGFVF